MAVTACTVAPYTPKLPGSCSAESAGRNHGDHEEKAMEEIESLYTVDGRNGILVG